MKIHLYFKLKTPCDQCPFRTDVNLHLRPERASEIAKNLLSDGPFSCHKTLDYRDDRPKDEIEDCERFCAGALIILVKEGSPNYLPRIGAAYGAYSTDDLDMDAPVFDSFDDFIAFYEKENE